MSAALAPCGTPAELVDLVLDGWRLVFSQATFAELESRIWRPKFDRYLPMERRKQILHELNSVSLWVDVPPEIASKGYCRDADDDKFIHAALAAGANWLITGDKDLLEVAPIAGLRILTPVDALQLAEFRQIFRAGN